MGIPVALVELNVFGFRWSSASTCSGWEYASHKARWSTIKTSRMSTEGMVRTERRDTEERSHGKAMADRSWMNSKSTTTHGTFRAQFVYGRSTEEIKTLPM